MTYGNPLTGMGTVNMIGPPPSGYFAFIEGPVWIGSLGTLFFSDNASSPTERIFKVVPPSTASALLADSGSNGLAVDNSDRIVAADQRNKRIAVINPMTGQTVGTPISTGSAKPNDVIVRSDDNIYFTDPDTGFYRISPSGAVSAAMKLTQSSRPNGIVLSTDENTLYVGDVGNRTIAKYTLAADGSVMTATGTNFVAQTMRDTVDGMCVDCAGNVYAGTSNGVEVYTLGRRVHRHSPDRRVLQLHFWRRGSQDHVRDVSRGSQVRDARRTRSARLTATTAAVGLRPPRARTPSPTSHDIAGLKRALC